MVTLRKATDLDVNWLIAAINHTYEINDNYFNFNEWWKNIFGKEDDFRLKHVQLYVNPKYPDQDLIIVNNGTKDVGFFSQDLDMQNMYLGATCYVHPKACKMTILKMVKACTIRGLYYLRDNLYECVEFNTGNALVTSIVESIINVDKTAKFNENYRVSFITRDTIMKQFDSGLEYYLKEKFNIEFYDKHNLLFSFKDK